MESQAAESAIAPQGAQGGWPPAGWVTRDEGARMFGVSWHTWKQWAIDGKLPAGKWACRPGGRPCKIYAVEDLGRLMAEMRATVFKDARLPGKFHVPDGFVTREQACRMFGITKTKWDRWTWRGRIRCGVQPLKNGPTIYAIDDLNRLVEEFGRLAPPYPDPDRPGCYRVPVHGHAMKRKEAIIDAESLPLIEGGRCHCPGRGEYAYVIFYTSHGRHDLLHRMILAVTDSDLVIRHVNRDPLDCRRENLVVR